MHIWPWVVHNFVYHIYVFLKIYFICLHPYLALGCSQFCISYLCIFKNIFRMSSSILGLGLFTIFCIVFMYSLKYISNVFIHIDSFHLIIKLWPNSVDC